MGNTLGEANPLHCAPCLSDHGLVMLIAVLAYATTMTIANLLVVRFGPSVTPLVAFVLIGLDLALRDWLHERLRPWQIGLLIVIAGLLAWAFNPAADRIAVASAVAFVAAACADWAVFATLRGTWLRRSVASNTVGAAVDSLIFATLAFGTLMPAIVLAQFLAKVAGSSLWAWLLSRRLAT